jgi:hypothetical protein
MKLRIRENSVRLRLTQSEVAKFAEKGLVGNKTEFGNGQTFFYSLSSSNSLQNPNAKFENGRIEISVPKFLADNWTQTEEVSISGNDRGIKIIVEKDFVCLNVREGEDESDAFPHPKEKETNC